MDTPIACMRCSHILPLASHKTRLWLCAGCAEDVPDSCVPKPHVYIGHADGWVCLLCGTCVPLTVPATPAAPLTPDSWED